MSHLALAEQSDQPDVSRAVTLRGWTSEAEISYLATKARGCTEVLELGSFVGRTARAMADNMGNGSVWCVDPLDPTLRTARERAPRQRPTGQWDPKTEKHGSLLTSREDGDRLYTELCDNLADLKAQARVFILREPSHIAVPRVVREGMRFDMAFIDGDHSYEAVRIDIALCLLAVRPGGLIIGDDYFEDGKHAGVKRSVDEMFAGRFERPVGKLWQVTV